MRFLPYPVVGGILAGTGWLLTTGAIAMMTDKLLGLSLLQPDVLPKWLPGLLFAVALVWAHERSSHVMVIPCMVLAATALFHTVMWSAGQSIAEVSA